MTKAGYRRLLPHRWKEDSGIALSEMVWREDMADFVLGQLRESVFEDLRSWAAKSSDHIVLCGSYDELDGQKHVAAVLWLGSQTEPFVRAPSTAGPDMASGPAPYAMRRHMDHYVPCYNLVALLGNQKSQFLREAHPSRFGGQIAVVKAQGRTKKLQLKLWKLLGFVNRFIPPEGSV